VVFSQRAALAGEGCRKRLFQELKVGDIVCGTVTNVTQFGVFVDLGGVEGLVHVSELSWGRVGHPHEVLQIGQKINAQILQISEETERVALSYKRLFHNPWSDLLDYYQPGDLAPATITIIMHFGAFARLKEGIEGLIHISSMNFASDAVAIKDILNAGQMVTVKILHIDINRKRLGLSLVDYE
jgi:small subunit ribosomal protein S1